MFLVVAVMRVHGFQVSSSGWDVNSPMRVVSFNLLTFWMWKLFEDSTLLTHFFDWIDLELWLFKIFFVFIEWLWWSWWKDLFWSLILVTEVELLIISGLSSFGVEEDAAFAAVEDDTVHRYDNEANSEKVLSEHQVSEAG